MRMALSMAGILAGGLTLMYYWWRPTTSGIHLFAFSSMMMGVVQLANALLNTPSHTLYCDGNAARVVHAPICMVIGLINVRPAPV
jgi:hypothetical protein